MGRKHPKSQSIYIFRFTFYDRDKEVGELTMTEGNKV